MHFNNIDTRRMATRRFFYAEAELRQTREWSNSEGSQHESLYEEIRTANNREQPEIFSPRVRTEQLLPEETVY